VVIVCSYEFGPPDEWLHLYWDEICRINDENNVSTRITRSNDPDFEDIILSGTHSAGVIMAGYEDRELIRRLSERHIPHLVLGISSEFCRFNVTENRMEAGRELLAALYKDGVRRAVFIGRKTSPNHSDAQKGCRQTASEYADLELTDIDAENRDISETVEAVFSAGVPDSIIIMGGTMPFRLYPFLKQKSDSLKFGFFTENPAVTDFRGLAYIASYSQKQAGETAVEMLNDIAAGRLTSSTAKYTETEILKP
jgi:DNA-binding LacI/PurR family transcriptional regulator